MADQCGVCGRPEGRDDEPVTDARCWWRQVWLPQPDIDCLRFGLVREKAARAAAEARATDAEAAQRDTQDAVRASVDSENAARTALVAAEEGEKTAWRAEKEALRNADTARAALAVSEEALRVAREDLSGVRDAYDKAWSHEPRATATAMMLAVEAKRLEAVQTGQIWLADRDRKHKALDAVRSAWDRWPQLKQAAISAVIDDGDAALGSTP